MHLLDWFKNLKWIKAIRDYDQLCLAINHGFEASIQAVRMAKLLVEKDQRVLELEEQLRQCQVVFHAHRSAAAQSIYEASEAKKDYERKLLDG